MGGEPVLGVVGEQPQDHLQATAPGAERGGAGFGVDLVRGQLRRDAVPGVESVLQFAARGADHALGRGDCGVLGCDGGVRVGEQRGEGPLGGGQFVSARRTRVFAALRAGLAVILVFASIAGAARQTH
jgi:hypothetical protein